MTCFRLASGETLRSYCRKNKYCYEAVFNRVDKGQTPDEALKDYLIKRGSKANNCKYYYKGKTLKAYLNNILEYQMCLNRIYRGMTVEQAVKNVERWRNERQVKK